MATKMTAVHTVHYEDPTEKSPTEKFKNAKPGEEFTTTEEAATRLVAMGAATKVEAKAAPKFESQKASGSSDSEGLV